MKKLLVQMLLMLAILCNRLVMLSADEIHHQEINESPVNFDGQEVKLKGIAKKPYTLAVGQSKILRAGRRQRGNYRADRTRFPKMNEEITIRAKVKSLAIVKGEALGLTVTELERYEQQQKI
jgi:hypothetical protein